MTDEETVQLLRLLAQYAREYGADVERDTTVRELAGDLIDSLPYAAEPKEARADIERVFGRDALT